MDTVLPASLNEILQAFKQENHALRSEIVKLTLAQEESQAAIGELREQVRKIGLRADDVCAKCDVLRQTSLRNAGWRLLQISELTEMFLGYIETPHDLRDMRMVGRNFRDVIDTSTTLRMALFWHPGPANERKSEHIDTSVASWPCVKHNPDFLHKVNPHPPPGLSVRSRTLNFTYSLRPGSGAIRFVWRVDGNSAAVALRLPAVASRTFLTQPALRSQVVVKFHADVTLQRPVIWRKCKRCRRRKKIHPSCYCAQMTTSAIVEKEGAQEACVDVLPISIGEMLCVAKAMITVNPGPVLPEAHLGQSSWSLRGAGRTSLDPSIAAIITSEPRYTACWDTGFLSRNRPVRLF